MSFASLHKWVTFLMAGLGLGSLFLGGELTLPVRIVILFAYLASMLAEGSRVHEPGWQRGWNIALLALLGLELVRGVLGEPPLALALEFTAALQISRLANRRAAAEHQQIAILAFLHLCAATVLSTELAYGAAFLGFVVVAPWMLALTHLRSEIEGHYPGDPDPKRAADVRRVLASKRVVGGAFLAGTAALSVPLFVMTAALFVAFPRVGLGWLSFGRGSPTHVAGFGGDVTLGQVGLVRDDPTIVLRVIPPGLEAPSDPAPHVAIRMRGTSFDHYDGTRWSRTRREALPLPREDDDYPIVRSPRSSDARWEIILDHLEDSVIFLPDRAIAVRVPPRVQSGIEIGRRLVGARGLDIRYEDPDALGLRYTAYVSADPRDALLTRIDPDEIREDLQLPEGHEVIADLARAWTEGARSDRERAERIEARLRGFEYSLEMRDPGDRPPLVAFVTEWRRGHCEYFSTAMAIMLRTLGIPTRNVTGLLGGRWNQYGGYYSLTHGDAHSWVEAWIDGEGWVTFDPTPSGRGELGIGAGLLDALAQALDAMRTSWEDDVVSFDLNEQRDIGRWIWHRFRSLRSEGAGGVESAMRGGPASVRPSLWPHALAALALAFAVVLGARVLRSRRAARAKVEQIPESAREAVALYRELERALAARGHARPASWTPREHAEALLARGIAGADGVLEITERYIEARYGGVAIEAAEIARLRARMREIAPRPE